MSAHGDSTKPIIVAIFANFIIAIAKAVGYFFSGSSALLSEAIHSVADVMNQALLYIGIKKGNKEEDTKFHYGYSQERFFWNLVSAMGIFVLGCGVTVYHGVHDLLHPSKAPEGGTTQTVIEAILIVSMIAEGYSFKIAIHEIKIQAQSRGKKFFEYMKESLDPSVSAVFWEDLAAILGIMLALLGIVLTSLTGNKTFDSIASITIGLLMGWIAFHLATENKKFLIDRSIPEYELGIIQSVFNKNKNIQSVKNLKSLVFGPNRLKVSASIELKKDNMQKLAADKFQSQYSNVKDPKQSMVLFSEVYLSIIQAELDSIQSELQKALPALKHIDLIAIPPKN